MRVIRTQTYTTSYSYDLANRITQIVYPSWPHRQLHITATSGYLTQVDDGSLLLRWYGHGAGFKHHARTVRADHWLHLRELARRRRAANDDNYWLTALNTVYSGTYVQELSFTQDYAGNYTAITDTLDSTRDESFGVDDLNRLHTASGKYGSRTYTYDNNSNRSTWYNGTITRTATFNSGTNTIASITDGTNTRHFTWSASGNIADRRLCVMNGAVAASMTYGGRDRLESITVGTPTVTFKVNALGQRVQKATTGATTDYLFDLAGHVIGEANDSTGSTTVEYIFMEGELLAQIDSSGNIYYAHNSQVSAAQKLTNASRTLVFDRIQEPFGEDSSTPTNTDPTNHRFPGQYADAEDLLNQNNNREYDPTLGYIEADPSGFGGRA